MRPLNLTLLLWSLLALALPRSVGAQPSSTPVAMVPFSVVGSETTKQAVNQLAATISAEIDRLPGFRRVKLSVAAASKANPELATCDGEVRCLAELGSAANAEIVIYGEIGGLGDAQVLYLRVVETKTTKPLRSTLLELGTGVPSVIEARAAVTRLLAPRSYLGSIRINVDVEGAVVFVDGVRRRYQAGSELELSVGSHALRITHPEFRDFVRFVDIEFDKTQTLDANLQQYPVVSSALRLDAPTDEPKSATAWYSRWYTVVGVGAVAFTATAVIFALRNRGVDADRREQVDVPQPALLTF